MKSNGLQHGIPTIAAISPTTSLEPNIDSFDAIVIGSGYAGLTAARDLTVAGAKVMLLEAPDRIGGRTWTSEINGHNFEMGGAYVHWAQPNFWREIARYQMQKGIEAAVDMEKGVTKISVTTPVRSRVMGQDEQTSLFASAFAKFINNDGGEGKFLVPFPHNPGFVPDAASVDQITLKDRLSQVEGELTPEESTALEAFLVVLSGAKLEDASLYDLLRLWALCAYSVDGLIALCSVVKLHDGQSSFARKFLDEALATRRLSYAFNHLVSSISDHGQQVQVQCTDGSIFRGARIVCTIPHNVLGSIAFTTSLPAPQHDVLHTPHVNRSVKVHTEVQPTELRTWMGVNYPSNKLIQATGEAVTPAGNARLVCFGAAPNPLQPEEDVEATIAAVEAFDHDEAIEVKRLVFTNWAKHEFAPGGCSWLPPLMGTTRNVGMLRQGHGNVVFANAAWAVGLRGFIDGAIEEGTRAAKAVMERFAGDKPEGSKATQVANGVAG